MSAPEIDIRELSPAVCRLVFEAIRVARRDGFALGVMVGFTGTSIGAAIVMWLERR